MTDVFISYAREDRQFVQRLHDALANDGHQAWVDWEGIPASAKWMAEVRAAIDGADCFCFVVSPDSVESPVCREEAAHAAASNKRILPLLHRPVDDGLLPETVAAHSWIEFGEDEDFGPAFAALVNALETEPEHLRTHTRLLVRAKEWDASKDSSLLLRGSDLVAAEGWLETSHGKDPRPTQLHTAYAIASRKAATRRQRTTIGAVVFALVVSLILSAVAVVQRSQAREAQAQAQERAAESRSREIAAAAVGQSEIDPELSLLLAAEAMDASRTPEAIEALRLALVESHVRATFVGHERAVSAASFDPDGRRIVTTSYDGTARIWVAGDPARSLILRGHEDLIESASFSPDGSRVVTASFDGTARVWDASTGREIAVLDGHEGAVHDATFGPGRSSVLTAGGDGVVIVWDMATGAPIRTLRGHAGPVYDVESSAETGLIVTASDDDTARVWDLRTGRSTVLRGHKDGLYSARFSSDGSSVVTSSEDGTAKVWDVRSGRSVSELRGSAGPVIDARFDPDGRRVVTASEDGTARVWDARSGRQLALLRGHQGELNDVSFGADGSLILTASVDGTARVWDAVSGTAVAVLRGHGDAVLAASFSPDGRHVVTGGGDGTARLWETLSGRVVFSGAISAMTSNPVGTTASVVTTEDGHVVVIDTASGEELLDVDVGSPQILAAVTADDKYVVSAGYDGEGHVWDVASGDHVADLVGHDPAWTGPDALAQVDRILTYGDDGTARIWEPATGREVTVVDHGIAGGLGIWEAHLSPDGTKLVTTGTFDGIVRVWDARTGGLIQEINGLLSGSTGIQAAFSPDGELVSTVSAYAAVWDLDTGEQVTVLESPDLIRGGAFSPDGSRFVSWSVDGSIRSWDPLTGRQLVQMSGEAGAEAVVSFSVDGRSIVAADAEGPVRIWDATTGELVATIDDARGMWRASFTMDGSIVSYGPGSVRIDPCDACGPPSELLELADTRSTRILTDAERREHLGDRSIPLESEEARPAGLTDVSGDPVLDGALDPGRYSAVGFPTDLSFEVDAGWFAATAIGLAGPGETQPALNVSLQRTDDPSATMSLASLQPGRLFDTRKDADERRNIVPFPEDLSAWLRSQPYRTVRERPSFDIGGIEGDVVDVRVGSVPSDLAPECGGCLPTLPITLRNQTGPIADDLHLGSSPGSVERWIVVRSRDGTILVTISADSRRAFEAFLPSAEGILASIDIAM